MEKGIEKIKKALGSVIKVAEKYDEAKEDNKVTAWEWAGIGFSAVGLIGAVKDRKEILDEYKDLDDAERDELHTYFVEEFDIRNDEVEAKIEKGFEFLLKIEEAIHDFLNK